MTPVRAACTAAALAVLATPALAADDTTTWYVGGAVVLANFQFDDDTLDDDAVGGRLSIGYRFNRWFAIEGSWLQTADFEDDQLPAAAGGELELGLDGFTFSAVGYAPLPGDVIDVYGKAGLYVFDQDLAVAGASGPGDNFSRRIDGLTVGAGIRARITDRIDLRAEGEWFDVDGADLWMASLGVDYRFGAPR
jgi:opacity protein-like surface antigen